MSVFPNIAGIVVYDMTTMGQWKPCATKYLKPVLLIRFLLHYYYLIQQFLSRYEAGRESISISTNASGSSNFTNWIQQAPHHRTYHHFHSKSFWILIASNWFRPSDKNAEKGQHTSTALLHPQAQHLQPRAQLWDSCSQQRQLCPCMHQPEN